MRDHDLVPAVYAAAAAPDVWKSTWRAVSSDHAQHGLAVREADPPEKVDPGGTGRDLV